VNKFSKRCGGGIGLDDIKNQCSYFAQEMSSVGSEPATLCLNCKPYEN